MLGSGAYGRVNKDLHKGVKVAVKQFIGRTEFVEIDVMSTYRHPNIMSALEIREDNEKPEILMPIGRHINDSDDIEEVFWGLIQGLTFLHSKGVLHLDLKPSNLLIVDGVVKIIDFGHAYVGSPESIKSQVLSTGFTEGFGPPETKYGTKSDVYSLGRTMLVLLGMDSDKNTPTYMTALIKNLKDKTWGDRILSMVSPKYEDRPEASDLLTSPIPGVISVYIPEIPDKPFPSSMGVLLEDSEDDVMIPFMILDLYYRSSFSFNALFRFVYFFYYGIVKVREPTDHEFVKLVFELKGNLGSCNILYRICDSVEALVEVYRLLKNGEISYSTTNFYELKDRLPKSKGSKLIPSNEFYKLLQN